MQFVWNALGYSDEGSQQEAAPPPEGNAAGFWSTINWVSSSVRNAATRLTGWDLGADEFKVVDPDGELKDQEKEQPTRSELWEILSSSMGMDVTNIPLPIGVFEPTTFLQRMSEPLQYKDLLDKAATMDDSVLRMAYVTACAIAAHSAAQRTGKPFNPVLGETYEYISKDGTAKFLAEHVSDSPPVDAAHTQGSGWIFKQETRVESKFCGNSVEVYARGKNYLEFTETAPCGISWTLPTTCIHNCIIGQVWIDCYGELELQNHATGERAIITFTPCGWFGADRFKVEGEVYDGEGNARIFISGKWSSEVVMQRLDTEGAPEGEPQTLWTVCPDEPAGIYKFTPYCLTLNEMSEEYAQTLPPTDSRLRPDRLALDQNDHTKASAEKSQIERKQRAEKRARANARTPVEWTPRWFELKGDALSPNEQLWSYKGTYWNRDRSHDAALAVLDTP